MNAIVLGPLILAPDRFAAIFAIAAFLIASEVLARKVDGRFSSWGWRAIVAFIVGARLGHVLSHLDSFATEPLRALAVWQGGFLVWAGVLLAIAYTAFEFRRHLGRIAWTLLPGATAAFVAVLVVQLTAGTPRTPLPKGEFLTLSGESVPSSNLVGQPLVVNLWASWCPPCRREMPMMADVAAGSSDAAYVFVNQGESLEAITSYLEAENIRLPTVLRDSLGEFARNYALPGLPATLFISSDGLLHSVHMGEISREALLQGVAELD
ncbi:TlpA disulfide reductase family protein [Kaistia adipata]|uniref:TlpA disulfide reductase family protein n=1 Tax=Kaistia adipata TaxID=166954 RepID=UPI0004082753|nr:TlpA disulfide reductase family protein [Kaistia adipata]